MIYYLKSDNRAYKLNKHITHNTTKALASRKQYVVENKRFPLQKNDIHMCNKKKSNACSKKHKIQLMLSVTHVIQQEKHLQSVYSIPAASGPVVDCKGTIVHPKL